MCTFKRAICCGLSQRFALCRGDMGKDHSADVRQPWGKKGPTGGETTTAEVKSPHKDPKALISIPQPGTG